MFLAYSIVKNCVFIEVFLLSAIWRGHIWTTTQVKRLSSGKILKSTETNVGSVRVMPISGTSQWTQLKVSIAHDAQVYARVQNCASAIRNCGCGPLSAIQHYCGPSLKKVQYCGHNCGSAIANCNQTSVQISLNIHIFQVYVSLHILKVVIGFKPT